MRMVMISQPMRGKTKEEILAVRDEAKRNLHPWDMMHSIHIMVLIFRGL